MDKGNGGDHPPLRKNWRFQLLWAGTGLSYLGDAAVTLALPILIILSTGSPVLAGLATTLSLGSSILLGAPAGVLVDRMDRRRILLFAEASQALVWGAFAALVYLDAVAVWNVILVAVLSGAAASFTSPAHASALQALVPKSQLAAAHAQGQARAYAIQLGGPPLGGVLYAVSRAAPFAFQVLASLVSVLCYVAAGVPRKALDAPPDSGEPDEAAGSRSVKDDLLEALRWLRGQRGLRAVLGVALFMNPLVNAIWVPIIILVADRGGGSVDTGIIMAGVGVGGLLGSLMATRMSSLVPAGRLVLLVGFLMGGSYCLVPLPLGDRWPIIPIIVSCLASPAVNVAIMALVGHLVPGTMMGRLSSLMNVTFQGFTPLGPIIGGLLASLLGGGGALVACGVSLVTLTAIASTSPALRTLRIPTDEVDKTSGPTPADDKERPAMDHETIKPLHEAGIIRTSIPPDAESMFSTLNDAERRFLATLSTRIRAALDPDVVAHSEDADEDTPCLHGMGCGSFGKH